MGEIVLKPLGLVVDPSPFLLPKGAMTEALNVVHRRPGLLEPRPGFRNAIPSASLPASTVRQLFWYAGKIYAVSRATSGGAFRVDRVDSTSAMTQITSSDSLAPRSTRRKNMAWRHRDNLYLLTERGVQKLSATGDAAFARAGLDGPATVIAGTTANTFTGFTGIESTKTIGIRACFRRTDANGYIRRSAPSPRLVIDVLAPGTVLVEVSIANTGIVAGDTIEIYRTLVAEPDIDPGDEAFLALEYVVVAADVTRGYTNSTYLYHPDADLGAALYTNASVEGIENANLPPPSGTDAAVFKGYSFIANHETAQRVILGFENTGGNPTDGNINTTGLQMRSTTATWGASPQTTMVVASASGIVVGMIITESGVYPGSAGALFQANTKVTVVAGTTITFDKATTGDDAGPSTVRFHDVITVDGVDYSVYGNVANSPAGEGFPYVPSPGLGLKAFVADGVTGETQSERIEATALSFANAINFQSSRFRAYVLPDDNDSNQRVVVEERIPIGGAAFTVTSSRGSAFAPAIPAAGTTSTSDDAPNGLAWSKVDEPEAWPLASRVFVGNKDPIEAIVPTRDALWILKRDGVFRLSGNGGDWSIDEMAPGLQCLSGDTADELNEWVYFLSNRGVVRVSDAGVEELTSGIIDTLVAEGIATLQAFPSSITDWWGFASKKDGEYWLGYPPGDATNGVNTAYSYNEGTRAWTRHRWLKSDSVNNQRFSCAAFNPTDGRMYLGGDENSTFTIRSERLRTTALDYTHDLEYAFRIDAISSLEITIEAGSGWTPKVGDAVLTDDGSAWHVVTSVTSATVFFLDSTTGLTVSSMAGDRTAYQSYPCAVEFVERNAADPTLACGWRDFRWLFERSGTLIKITSSFESEWGGPAADPTLTALLFDVVRKSEPQVTVPRAHAWSSFLKIRADIRQALADFRLAGLAVDFDGAERAVRRSYG